MADNAEQVRIAEVADDTEQKKYAVSDMFCRDQLAKVEAGRKPDYELDVCDKLLRILEFICTNKEEILERVGAGIEIEIVADSSMDGNSCVIETDSGVFDCSLGVQLENLIKDIKSLCL